jgi:hypothetical protein
MSLLAQAQELKVESKSAGLQQATKVMTTDIDRLQAFAAACVAQFPKLNLNENALKNGRLAPTGDTMVPFAAIQKAPNGSVTVYYNGRVVFAGALTALKWPAWCGLSFSSWPLREGGLCFLIFWLSERVIRSRPPPIRGFAFS